MSLLCAYCDTVFFPRAAHHRFCCDACRYSAQSAVKGIKTPYESGRSNVCQHCGRAMEGRARKFCDMACTRRRKHRLGSLPERSCEVCQKPFVPRDGSNKHCSERCRQKKRNDFIKPIKRAGEKVDPMVVFARDKWVCGFCGVGVAMALRGTVHPCAPEIDHLVPLTRGGEHTYANCHTVCRRCNGLKGARLSGQTRRFG
jgi:5-methylcytosine-specific restriction endonuclease McrA